MPVRVLLGQEVTLGALDRRIDRASRSSMVTCRGDHALSLDLLLGTILLRPYVFGFLLAFLAAGRADLGWRAHPAFMGAVWPVAWVAEFASTRVGVPFGLYHYTETTRGRELFIANVPFFDSLSFVFLAYAAFCLARLVLRRGRVAVSRPGWPWPPGC